MNRMNASKKGDKPGSSGTCIRYADTVCRVYTYDECVCYKCGTVFYKEISTFACTKSIADR